MQSQCRKIKLILLKISKAKKYFYIIHFDLTSTYWTLQLGHNPISGLMCEMKNGGQLIDLNPTGVKQFTILSSSFLIATT